MEFEKTIMSHEDVYISGIYKCVKRNREWSAFFMPVGWANWGNSCERTNFAKTKHYTTLKQAQAACRRHAKKFKNPQANDKLLVE